ncbi:FtsH protease activity modulator HflK [Haliea sp. AH-315-K21]|uniref:Protein HflK n=1 Tax=SAR86 cluster bacterium TaxID=2030880 RepID=A0A2A5C9R8_9GAMM|nr:FtsH protease activity modulator HflK [Haliea sp. AH-315-K21]MBN4075445.1 FtsH protease activity modulator HflK [Gammaproteobacteria bacterium AH-315-E17]PCJ40190.1 MAG: FtsH protease activity modulator HflK [SAR86 cluster bacterium]
MAWNEPDNNDGKKNESNDPWGSKRPSGGGGGNNQGPPDLDEVITSLIKKFSGIFGGNNNGSGNRGTGTGGGNSISGGLMLGITTIVAIIWAGSGFYTVDEQERGVVLRFGKALEGVVMPGLHWNPQLVDTVTKINVTRVYDESFTNSMLTEDDNIVDVSMTVQYQVTDARAYYLNVRDPETSLRLAAESAIRHEIGSSEMETATTSGRQQISLDVMARLQRYMDLYQTGIIVSEVNIAEVQQPAPVRAAYDDVIKAGVDREAYQNEANAYANQVIPEARGFARRVLEEAGGYRDQVVAQAEGEAQRFSLLLVEYQRAPEVTRERLYLETMQEVLSNSSKVLFNVEGGNNMMVLPLDQILQRSGNVSMESMSTQDIRNLSNQVIQDLNRQTTTRAGR